MSAILTGTPTNITTPLTATVTALSNFSGEVEVTTSTSHEFGDGDTVLIEAGLGAQGTFPIAVIDPTHFVLVGSTYTSPGAGTVTDLSLTPQVQCPTDGDTFSAQISGLLSSQQSFLDRTQYLNQQIVAANNVAAAGLKSISLALNNWTQSKYNVWVSNYYPGKSVPGSGVLSGIGMYTTGPIAWDPVTSQWIWFSVIQVGGGGSSLPGTYSPNNYTTAVVASGGSPVGAVTDGNIVEFSSQSGVSYLLTNVVSLGLAIWPPYNGTSGSGVTATGPSYFSHFHGSEDGGKTVTNDQSLGSGAQVYFSLCFANIVSPGCGYAIENTASSNRYWINPVTFSYGVQSGTQVTGGNAIYYPHNSTFVEFSWVQSGATFTGQGYTANTNPSSPALADVTTSLPSQWRSGTATITQIFCASGTQYNDCLFGMSCSSGDSRLMEVTVGVFSGLTFTDQTPSFLSGRQIVGMAYDSVHNLYGVLLDNGKLYTSLAPSKSTSWTLTYTFTPTATRLATVGGVWAVGLAEGASGNVARVYISSDITGSPTWHATGGCFSTDITSSGKLSYLVSSGNSLAAISDTSLQMAFSNMVGYA